jgi:hypothetical protein
LAKKHLDRIYDYIANDSISAARKVKKEIINLAHSLKNFLLKNILQKNRKIIVQKQNGVTR